MRGPETVRVPPSYNGAPTAPASAASPDAAEAAGGATGSPASIVENLSAWWADTRRMAHDHLELASLEVERAAQSLITIAICALVALLLLAATWLGVMAAITIGLTALGLAAGWSILLVALLNLIGAVACLLIIKRKTPYLKFPATVASLKPGSARTAGKEGM